MYFSLAPYSLTLICRSLLDDVLSLKLHPVIGSGTKKMEVRLFLEQLPEPQRVKRLDRS